jgi:hypothetical protein
MNKFPLARVFLLTLVVLLSVSGCRNETASPAVSLATLERPVIVLPAASDTQRTPRLLIPRTALVERGGLPGVFVLQDGQARFRMVRIGKSAGNQLEVLSGLAGGETLVLGNLTEVHDGSPVAVK